MATVERLNRGLIPVIENIVIFFLLWLPVALARYRHFSDAVYTIIFHANIRHSQSQQSKLIFVYTSKANFPWYYLTTLDKLIHMWFIVYVANYSRYSDAVNDKSQLITELQTAYNMELETVHNYLAISINLDGLLAEELKEILGEDVGSELGHAKINAERIHVLGGIVPYSKAFKASQDSLQLTSSTELLPVILGVIDAESAAIVQYKKIVEISGKQNDLVTQNIILGILEDEEKHLRQFKGFLAEYQAKESEA